MMNYVRFAEGVLCCRRTSRNVLRANRRTVTKEIFGSSASVLFSAKSGHRDAVASLRERGCAVLRLVRDELGKSPSVKPCRSADWVGQGYADRLPHQRIAACMSCFAIQECSYG